MARDYRIRSWSPWGKEASGLSHAAIFAAVWLGTPAPASAAPDNVVCDRILENFASSKVGAFPAGWRTKEASEMSAAKRSKSYVVEQDGPRKILHAVYRDRTFTIGKAVKGWDLAEYPILRFEWKAVHLPKGGNEDSMSKNDCAASVYAFWDVGFPYYVDSIKYTWSSSLPVGTRIKKRLGHDVVVVRESGATNLSQWRTVQVNVKADYERLFGKDQAPGPSGVAVLTDADATESAAEAYYADFRLCRLR